MAEWMQITALTLAAGLAMPIGAALASVERIRPRWLESELRHTIIAFGGGALLAAVSLVLVPEGIRELSLLSICLCFLGGGVLFMLLDRHLAKSGTPASQLTAMLSDFIPEALALGATFTVSHGTGLLLATIIALQNLPEGFNAYRELASKISLSRPMVIAAFAVMAMLGPISGLIGYFWLADSPAVVAGIMLFAAGGILYIIFQDIAPQAKLRNHWAPPLGAIAGFMLGMIGKTMLSG